MNQKEIIKYVEEGNEIHKAAPEIKYVKKLVERRSKLALIQEKTESDLQRIRFLLEKYERNGEVSDLEPDLFSWEKPAYDWFIDQSEVGALIVISSIAFALLSTVFSFIAWPWILGILPLAILIRWKFWKM
jgi:hypothetical protein